MTGPTDDASAAEKMVHDLTRRDVARYVRQALPTDQREAPHATALEVLLWALILEVRRLSSELRELRVGDVGGDR